MKKLLFIITTLLVLASCATTNESNLSKAELRNEKKILKQAVVKNAIESKKYIIKLDKLYLSGIVSLIPRSNYIIIDGDKAIISAAYIGKQYDARGIAAMDMIGRSTGYEMTEDFSKGMYNIEMKIKNGYTSFDVHLRISKNGTCSASVSNLKLDYVRYSGYVVPISGNGTTPSATGDMI
jgi:hypothetical protein